MNSRRYGVLKDTYAAQLTVLEPNCSDWSTMIEQQAVDTQAIAARIEEVLEQGADVIVLACTHYHWIEAEITKLAAGRARVIQPEASIIKQLQRVLTGLTQAVHL